MLQRQHIHHRPRKNLQARGLKGASQQVSMGRVSESNDSNLILTDEGVTEVIGRHSSRGRTTKAGV